MQKAIEDYIKIQSKNMIPLNEIEDEIIKVERAAIQKARKRQYRQWRGNQHPIR